MQNRVLVISDQIDIFFACILHSILLESVSDKKDFEFLNVAPLF